MPMTALGWSVHDDDGPRSSAKLNERGAHVLHDEVEDVAPRGEGKAPLNEVDNEEDDHGGEDRAQGIGNHGRHGIRQGYLDVLAGQPAISHGHQDGQEDGDEDAVAAQVVGLEGGNGASLAHVDGGGHQNEERAHGQDAGGEGVHPVILGVLVGDEERHVDGEE